MKRLIVGMAATMLMAAGLMGVSAESANAACPYTGCVPTSTSVTVPNAPIQAGNGAKICVKVQTAGSGEAQGKVKLTVTRNKGGFSWSSTKGYIGKTCFTTPPLKKKKGYNVQASFLAAPTSAFGDSNASGGFNVVKK